MSKDNSTSPTQPNKSKRDKLIVLVIVGFSLLVIMPVLFRKYPKPPQTMDEAVDLAKSLGFTHSLGHSPVITVSTKPIVVDPIEGDFRMDTAIGWEDSVRIFTGHRSFQAVPGLAHAEWGPLTLYGDERAVKKLVDATPTSWFPW